MWSVLAAATVFAANPVLFRTLDDRQNTLKIETLDEADAFFRTALRGKDNRPSGVGCATPEALHARDILVENNPAHGIVAEIMIHGDVSTYETPMFKILYTKDASSTDVPPLADTNTDIPMPDGSTRHLAADGVPDYIEKAGHYLEFARLRDAQLGFAVPSPKTEVRIVNVDRSYSMAIIGITLSNHAPDWYLPWLTAHEFFHQVQVAHTPGDFGISFAKLSNPDHYDTFPLEGTANVGADYSFGGNQPWWGSQTGFDPTDYLKNTDVSFWNQSYDSSEFWSYLAEQHAVLGRDQRGLYTGSEIIRTFWQKRGAGITSTSSALEKTLSAVGGADFETFLKRFRVAIAVKGHFNVDTTVSGPLRTFDFSGDGASSWPAVAITKEFTVASPDQKLQSEIKEDRGAQYFRIIPGAAKSYVVRLVGGSNDIRAQVAQVWQKSGQRGVAVTELAGKDGKTDATVTVADGTFATYAIVESTDGTQPFVVELNPASEKVPDLSMKCGSAVPLGTPESGRDTAAAVQITLLVAVMMLAVRLHRRRD